MLSQAEKIARFRALHEEDGIFVIPNPWDAGTARVLASLGFKALATTSAGMAFSLGLPEGRINLENVLAHCRSIVSATDLPVSADMENGFADAPAGVAKAIPQAAATGLAGCSIEDFSGDSDKPIYDFGLTVERVTAAVEAARALPGDFILTARAENFLHGRRDLDDTIKRLQAFEEAGADVLYAPGLNKLDDIRSLCSSVGKPVNVVMGLPGATFGIEDLAMAGVRRISVGSAFSRLAFGAVIAAVREILDQGTFTFTKDAAGFAQLEDIFRGYEQ
ncbi:isocitrate lyase/PEP mutase family protein [Denitrobaculum tricleocarpae]|uniref:Isocitrate lyase/phosphoenolpyruvate mutase family protein n=1 Tax=Denitrobaculum tricleocarpae TaxID=2591009 RepID=A0A545TWU3_9PROT|nr:isocitrate lyase/phosphoenolpyruvate mutase family protein [Denitrobaculum tricleocarpae]TQV81679.1 isocitrate lyase/phosphoenolpyruvate mutase family protein [Denitrobaculum tricleocarpae]